MKGDVDVACGIAGEVLRLVEARGDGRELLRRQVIAADGIAADRVERAIASGPLEPVLAS